MNPLVYPERCVTGTVAGFGPWGATFAVTAKVFFPRSKAGIESRLLRRRVVDLLKAEAEPPFPEPQDPLRPPRRLRAAQHTRPLGPRAAQTGVYALGKGLGVEQGLAPGMARSLVLTLA
jgi:hypothetical protein